MKTLDEVIQEFERQEAFVVYYMQDKTQFRSDALHYLKEYRDLKETMDWHEEMENIRNNLTNLLMNPPLSWEELRQMQDKPVWWMHGEVGEWLTIYRVPTLGNGNDDVIYATTCSGVECWIYRKDLDKFQYYRKEK